MANSYTLSNEVIHRLIIHLEYILQEPKYQTILIYHGNHLLKHTSVTKTYTHKYSTRHNYI